MTNDDRSLERAARSWLEEGPAYAPDHAVETALSRIQTTPQERDLNIPWRFPTMNPISRLAAVALVAVVAIAGASYLFGRGSTGPASQATPAPTAPPTAAPTARPTPPLMAGPLAFGTYVGPTLQVADIVAAANADTMLTAADRTQLIDVLFDIKDKITWTASLELRGGQLTQRQTVDGVTLIGSLGRYAFPDDHTLVYTENNGSAVTTFDITVNGDSFTLYRTTPNSDAVDAFISRILFESGPFTLR